MRELELGYDDHETRIRGLERVQWRAAGAAAAGAAVAGAVVQIILFFLKH